MPNVRIIAKGQRGDSLTKLKVNFAPSQSSTPSLMPETNSVYLSRPTEGTGELMELVGGTVAWNQLQNTITGVAVFAGGSGITTSVTDGVLHISGTPSAATTLMVQPYPAQSGGGHVFLYVRDGDGGFSWGRRGFTDFGDVKYGMSKYGSDTHLSVKITLAQNTAYNVYCRFNIIDLTQFFNPTIADYVYSLEQATAGSGIAWLKSYGFFTEDYIAYSAPTLQSVEATSHVTKDSNNTVIATYPLDSDLVLRGIPKLSNGNLYYDGDTYEWDGTVNRKYGYRAYQNGDVSDGSTMITDGSHTVYKLNTPTTESADPFTAVQSVEDGGTEEFVTTNGVPVGVVGRFANAVPMEGVDSFTVTANDGTSHTYPVTLSEEIYRGYVDMLTGEAVSDMASIAEYNGETINAPWLSSLDVYSLGATPTKGAQVVYPITPEEVTATITGDPTELGNVTSASSTEGTVEWSAMAPLDGKCIVRVVS